ncbi:hypothetical protein ATN89_17420 [Comamonas thiooxydans]|uniref:tail fiber domain-containing protein n=1 Tax=Comamonas thiooxydans TaxID=363952 RepID=UPI0007C4BCAA|nr:tail fiber domain-containing protein [Comamonas thiooxydans]OAD82862.1 hypothetical protein ATN89_17420 [Comamonas thiooxydans]
MEWYKRGNATVVNGSAKVICSLANFVDNIERGEAFVGPDGKHYEIKTVVSATEITLARAYAGPSTTAPYEIIPVQGYSRELAHSAADIINAHKTVSSDVLSALESANLAIEKAAESAVVASEAMAVTTENIAKSNTHATNAKNSETNAAASAGNAAASATSSSSSAAQAQKWATQTTSEVVTGQGYGAKYYADQAKTSQTASKTSETNAKTSETNAASSKTAAAASQTAAAASQTAAKTSETNAAASQTAAKTSETNAAASQTAAAGSASTASSKATEASNSASNAAASALNAKTSETNSKTSETAAAASAAAAKESEDTARSIVGSVQNSFAEMGGVDLSTGKYPATPGLASIWRVQVGGTVSGVLYEAGDFLIYSKVLAAFYRINNSAAVTTVNGKTGAVVLSAADVGAATKTDNVASATKLQTARTIGGVSFDGTANINLPGVNTAGNQSTTGNAATATKLQTARTINGVNFDGTSNIALQWQGVPIASNQDLNDFKNEGAYYCAANVTAATLLNCPTGEAFSLRVWRAAGYIQELTTYRSDSGRKTYQRAFYGVNEWSAWERVYTTNDPPLAVSGNAGTATKLQTARTISMAGAATGTATVFDGSGNAIIPVTALDASMLTGEAPLSALVALGVAQARNAPGNGGAATDGGTDFDTMVTATAGGFYTLSGTYTNGPLGASASYTGVIHIIRRLYDAGSAVIQTVYSGNTSWSRTGARGASGWVFTDWAENVTTSRGTATAAAKLATVRSIGGVNFDGTANIDLPGVNTTGNQNTTGSAAKLTTARTVTIGSTARSFDGSANIAWTLADLGLGNVNNTSDANKPISTATQTALNAKLDANKAGAKSGVATLDSGGFVPEAQLSPDLLSNVLNSSLSVGGANLQVNSSFEARTEEGEPLVGTVTVSPKGFGSSIAGTSAVSGEKVTRSYVESPLAQSSVAFRMYGEKLSATRYMDVVTAATIPAQPGDFVVASSHIRGTVGATFRMYLQWRNASNGTISTPSRAFDIGSETDFQRCILAAGPAPAGTTGVYVYFGRINGIDGVTPVFMDVDNVQIEMGKVATAYKPSALDNFVTDGLLLSKTANLDNLVTPGDYFSQQGLSVQPGGPSISGTNLTSWGMIRVSHNGPRIVQEAMSDTAPYASAMRWSVDSGKTWKAWSLTSLVESANKLQTARTINGVEFDGTGNITVNAPYLGNASGAMPTGTATYGLTSGVYVDGIYNGTASGYPITYGNRIRLVGHQGIATTEIYHEWQSGKTRLFVRAHGDVATYSWTAPQEVAFVSGNVASATKLLNTRTINGTDFDGTSDIVVPASIEDVTAKSLNTVLSAGFFHGSRSSTDSSANTYADSLPFTGAADFGGVVLGSSARNDVAQILNNGKALFVRGNDATGTPVSDWSEWERVLTDSIDLELKPGKKFVVPDDPNSYISMTAANVSNVVAPIIYAKMGGSDAFRLGVGATSTNNGFAELATADDGSEQIYVRQYTGSFAAIKRQAALLDENGNTNFPGQVSTINGFTSATGTSYVASLRAGGSILQPSNSTAGAFMPFLAGNTTSGSIGLATYQGTLRAYYMTKANVDANTNSVSKNAVLLDENGNGIWDGNLAASTFSGNGAALTSLNAGNISAGTLPVARGGTGTTTSTGSGNVVLSTSPTISDSLSIVATGKSAAIEIGDINGTVATTPYIDFHSGTSVVDYDSRIMAYGGTTGSAGGVLQVVASMFETTAAATIRSTSIASKTDATDGALRVLGGVGVKGVSVFGDRVGIGTSSASSVQLDVLQNTIVANSSPFGSRILVDVKDGALTASRTAYGEYARIRSYLTYANGKELGFNMTTVAGHFEAQDAIDGAHTQELYGVRGYAVVSQPTGGTVTEQVTGRIEGVRGYSLLSAANQTATTVIGNYSYPHLNNSTAVATNMIGYEAYVRNQAGTATTAYGIKVGISGTFSGVRYGIYSTGESENLLSGILRVNATTAATSTTTGSLIVKGGAGFAGQVFAAGFNGPLTGNASTATKLAIERTINGVSFDGSANVSGAMTLPTAAASWIDGTGRGQAAIVFSPSTASSWHAWASQKTAGGNSFAIGQLGESWHLSWASAANINAGTNVTTQLLRADSNGLEVTGSVKITSSGEGQLFFTSSGGYAYGNSGAIGFYKPNVGGCAMDNSGNWNVANSVNATRIYVSDWLRTTGNCGWYSESYGGGMMMQDSTWVRVYNGKALYVGNEGAFTGNVTAYYSDKRLKTKLKPIKGALAAVAQLTGYHYHANKLGAKYGYDPEKAEVGLLAQDVQAIIPEVVEQAPFDRTAVKGESKTGKFYLTLKYERLVPHLVEAIKELDEKNQALELRLASLEAAIRTK